MDLRKIFEQMATLPIQQHGTFLQGCTAAIEGATAQIAAGEPALSRFDRQKGLEQQLVAFRPDFNEAAELLDALMAGAEARGDFAVRENEQIEAGYQQLRAALVKADLK